METIRVMPHPNHGTKVIERAHPGEGRRATAEVHLTLCFNGTMTTFVLDASTAEHIGRQMATDGRQAAALNIQLSKEAIYG